MPKKDKVVIVIGVWSFLIVVASSFFGWQGAAVVWGFVGFWVIMWLHSVVDDLETAITSLKEADEKKSQELLEKIMSYHDKPNKGETKK